MNSLSPSGFKNKARDALGSILEHAMAEESRLAATTRAYVWRVRGSPVQSLRRLFSEQGRQIERWVGDLRERARGVGVSLGLTADETREAATAEPVAAGTMVRALLEQHEHLAARLRQDLETLDGEEAAAEATGVLRRLLEFHETTAWMLRLLVETSDPFRPV